MLRDRFWFRPLAGLMPAVLLLVLGCSVNPATGHQQLSFYDEQEEIAMGREADQDIVGHVGLYDNPAVQAYVSDLGKKLAAQSERPNLPWSFKVLDDPAINAFALPGGYVYVTRGILTHLGSEAELATVMGHEIGHVTARHSVSQMSKKRLAAASIGVALILADSKEALALAGVAALGMGLVFLSYSRSDESQADQLGLRYAQRAGYDLRESPEVFRLLDRVAQNDARIEGTGRLPRWLSTHPDPGSRRERLEQKVAEMEKGGTHFDGTTVNRDVYLSKIDGMRFGDNPREGFVRDGAFLHPDLQVQLTLPAGWKAASDKDSITAQSPKGDAFLRVALMGIGTPDEAADVFFREAGVNREKSWESKVHGQPAVWSDLDAKVNSKDLLGTVAFVSHQKRIFQVLGVSGKNVWAGYQPALQRSIESFDRITDPKTLAIQPRQIKVVRLKKALTLEDFAKAFPSTVPVETVAVINHVEPGGTLEAGRMAKQVVGGVEVAAGKNEAEKSKKRPK
ncbi:MAG TPA: M48 family metalloprotease [Thermoanaerobaculia bacterium]|nr:M48 family metalloprotease [Thermoanaerobaculia bacterium]